MVRIFSIQTGSFPDIVLMSENFDLFKRLSIESYKKLLKIIDVPPKNKMYDREDSPSVNFVVNHDVT